MIKIGRDKSKHGEVFPLPGVLEMGHLRTKNPAGCVRFRRYWDLQSSRPMMCADWMSDDIEIDPDDPNLWLEAHVVMEEEHKNEGTAREALLEAIALELEKLHGSPPIIEGR